MKIKEEPLLISNSFLGKSSPSNLHFFKIPKLSTFEMLTINQFISFLSYEELS